MSGKYTVVAAVTNSYTIWDWFCAPLQPLHCSAFNLAGKFHQGREFALFLLALLLLALSLFCYFALLLFCSFTLRFAPPLFALSFFALSLFKKIVFFTVFSLLFTFLCPRANRSVALLYMSDHKRIAIWLFR